MVYTPAEDSYLLEEQVKIFSKNKKVLDMGSGSGIQAKRASVSGAKSVLAVDINKKAIVQLKNQKIQAIQSDLFNNVSGKFDLIIFNPPYLPEDEMEDKKSALETTGGINGDEITLRFLTQSVNHLEGHGTILILLSSLTPKGKINKTIKRLKLKKTKLSEKKLFMETLEVWKLTKAQ